MPKPGQSEVAAKQSLPKIATISHFSDKKTPPKTEKVMPVSESISRHKVATPAAAPKIAATVKPEPVKSVVVKPTRSFSDIRPHPTKTAAHHAVKAAVMAPVKPASPKPAVAAALPVHGPDHLPKVAKSKHHKVRAETKPKASVVKLSHITAGVLTGGLAAASFELIHKSQAASLGGWFHFLATRSLHTRLLSAAVAPAVIVGLASLVALWLWLRGSAIFAGSKVKDARPIPANLARRAGLNALASLSLLAGLSVVLLVAWSVGLILAIKYIGHLSFSYWQLASLGVTTSFIMVLIGLWIAAIITTAGYMVVLSGQKLMRSLSQAAKLASANYAYTAGTALWMMMCLAAAATISTASFIALSIHRLNLPLWLVVVGGSLITALLAAWLSAYSLKHWLNRYRQDSEATFKDSVSLYWAGRRPKPVSKVGVSLSVAWWLAVAIVGSLIIWHFKLDPTNLFNKLSADIY